LHFEKEIEFTKMAFPLRRKFLQILEENGNTSTAVKTKKN
jgi:hypothetical protein